MSLWMWWSVLQSLQIVIVCSVMRTHISATHPANKMISEHCTQTQWNCSFCQVYSHDTFLSLYLSLLSHSLPFCICACMCVCVCARTCTCLTHCASYGLHFVKTHAFPPSPNPYAVNMHLLAWKFLYVHYKLSFIQSCLQFTVTKPKGTESHQLQPPQPKPTRTKYKC